MGQERRVTRIGQRRGPKDEKVRGSGAGGLYQAQLLSLSPLPGAGAQGLPPQGPTLSLTEELYSTQRDKVRVAVSGSY